MERFGFINYQAIQRRQNKGEVAAEPALIERLSSAVRRSASGSATARWVYRAVQTSTFARPVGSQSLDLFHALSFMPPADPGVPTLPVVYDLSLFAILRPIRESASFGSSDFQRSLRERP